MFGSKAFLTALVLLHVVQFSEGKSWWKRYAGYCNAASSNCGAGCNVDSDCPGGACWADMDDCSTSGYCNAASSNCGAGCNIQSDCPGGDCWANYDDCGTSSGYCNAASSNCGAGCSTDGECPGGACWANHDDCGTASGYCNAASSNCGAGCSTDGECPGGACWANHDDCGTTSGYCNAASSNCGAGCNTANDCPGGDCWKNMDDCGGTPTGDHIVGTYLGMLPGGISAPPLSSVPSEVNYMLLGFAEDPSQTGNFEAFSMWVSMGITYKSITDDKEANPGRKYMISIGGSADSGGTFGIAGDMSVSQWVANADNSISSIVNSYNADGVDIQFEGGTSDPDFSTAIPQLAQRLKARGFLVSVGPFYGGTWNDYISLPLNDVDYVFCQFYAKNLQSVDSVVSDITSAANDLGSWSKLIAGFNSNNRNPNPSTSLQAVYQLKSSLKGTFTWTAEDSQSNSPSYCIEKNSANILNNNQQPGSCNW